MPRDLPAFEVETKPSVADVLKRARTLIDTPEKWCQDAHSEGGALCAEGALNKIERGHPEAVDLLVESRAWALLRRVVGGCIWHWNDWPATTHADVMAAFDRAIALAERE